MAWFLVVLFFSGPAPDDLELREGWHPLKQTDRQMCQESVTRTQAYLESVKLPAVVFCRLRKDK